MQSTCHEKATTWSQAQQYEPTRLFKGQWAPCGWGTGVCLERVKEKPDNAWGWVMIWGNLPHQRQAGKIQPVGEGSFHAKSCHSPIQILDSNSLSSIESEQEVETGQREMLAEISQLFTSQAELRQRSSFGGIMQYRAEDLVNSQEWACHRELQLTALNN